MKSRFFLLLFFITSYSFAYTQVIDASFFQEVDQVMKTYVKDGKVDYKSIKSHAANQKLLQRIATANLQQADANTKKAFYINAYNLLVVSSIVVNYPLSSVQTIPDFFDKQKYNIAGEFLTLMELETEKLLKVYKDARLHFVLNCGAVDCPQLANFAYTPDNLDAQLNSQTKVTLNDNNFIKIGEGKAAISQIFKWYINDFGGNPKGILDFINQYRDEPISSDSKITYYPYDWNLNDQVTPNTGGNNSSRYVVSAAIPKGSIEAKLFNNLYTQTLNDITRATFFTSTLSVLYGVTNRLNAGVEFKYRRVDNGLLPKSRFDVFGTGEAGRSRVGITGIGPKIRFAPFASKPNLSIQSTFYFPIGEDLQGNSEQPFIDWNGAIFITQVFNDKSIGTNFSLFTEIDFIVEGIGKRANGFANRFSTPVTAIFSYFPTSKATLYTLAGFSPFYYPDLSYFAQAGLGAKYQFKPTFEVELLATLFTNPFLMENNGAASTLNIGLRYNY